MRRPFLAIVATAAIVLLAAVLCLTWVRARTSATRLPAGGEERLEVDGLAEPVTVLLDSAGSPHVLALSETDMWFVQGYLHARDRFFQMDTSRREATGRLAEVYGERMLGWDRAARAWRLAATARRQAAQLDASERIILDAYAAGVNAALEDIGRWISPEMWILAVDPRPWTVEDSLAIVLLFQLRLGNAVQAELQRAATLAALGRERAVDLWGWTPAEAESWIPPVEPAATPSRDADAIAPPPFATGSVAWALAPARSATGRPVVANELFFRPEVPAPWFVVHLRCPELDVAGLSLSGVPGVVVGHTAGVAWGLTPTRLDDQDLFRLTLDETRSRERIDGSWQPLRTVTERITVLGREAPELVKLRLSERGPIVRETGREALALAWSGSDGPSAVHAFLRMDRAQSVAEVAAAWQGVTGPSMSLTAADVGGHILHQVVGQVPVRDRGAGRLPAPGEDSRWAWRGYLPMAANPHEVDPTQGFVLAAEHDLFSEGDYPGEERFPADFVPPWRARLLRQQLAGRTDWDAGDSVALMLDVVSPRARVLLDLLQADIASHPGPTAAAILSWDGRMGRDSLAAHLWARFIHRLGVEIGGDEALRHGLPASPVGAEEIARLAVGALDETWWDDVTTAAHESRRDIVHRALDRVDELRLDRPWGSVHRLAFEHRFRDLPLFGTSIGRAWSLGPFPAAGSEEAADGWSKGPDFDPVAAPSARLAMEVGDWDLTLVVLPPGQSGRPWSPHYADQVRSWLAGATRTLPFTPRAVAAAARARLQLEPVGKGPGVLGVAAE
jgi:penicillin amidase